MRSPAWFVLAAFLLLVSPGAAQLALTGVGGGFGNPAGGGSPTFTAGTGSIFNNAFAAGFTWTGMNSGVNWPSGALVAIVVCATDSPTFASPTIGGQAATLAAQETSHVASLYYALMPASEPDTFSISNATCCGKLGAAAVYMTNLASSTPDSTATEAYGAQADPQTTSTPLTIVGSGFGVAGACAASGTTTPTWNTGTGVVNLSMATAQLLVGKLTSSGTPSVSGSGGTYNFAMGMAAASWH